MTAPQRRQPDTPKAKTRITKAERRRLLLQHGRHLFMSRGYDAMTLEELATVAVVKPAVVAKYYADKKTLFADILGAIKVDTLDRLLATAAEPSDPLARLHLIAENCLTSIRRHRVEWRFVHLALSEADNADVAEALRGFFLGAETMLAAVIVEGQQSGVFRRSIDPRVGAWELIRSALGHSYVYPVGMPLHAETDYVARSIDCLLHCLMKTDV